MINGIHLDYQELRSISPEAARRAILQVLRANRNNVTETAKAFKVTRKTIYKAIKKEKEKNLKDSSKVAHVIHNKTATDIEEKVVAIKKKTQYGPLRIKDELQEVYGIEFSEHTIRNIVRRNKQTCKGKRHTPAKKGERQFVNWYEARAFEIVQVDLKYIVDQKALSAKQVSHIYEYRLPLYQWGAEDVYSRFKLIGYSDEKSWTNGLTWFLWVISWLRSHGVTTQIIFTVDHGEEFGGKSWLKMVELKKLLAGFGCKLIQNTLKHPEENAHLERSHRTDDDEFYIPRILTIKTREHFFQEALNYLYYYNNVRKHSSLGRLPPFIYLKQHSEVFDTIRIIPPVYLDTLSVSLGQWSGYHLLAHHPNLYKLL